MLLFVLLLVVTDQKQVVPGKFSESEIGPTLLPEVMKGTNNVAAAKHLEADTDRPNILFIFDDQRRKDAVSAYGGINIQTPSIDRLANDPFFKKYTTLVDKTKEDFVNPGEQVVEFSFPKKERSLCENDGYETME